MKSIFTCSSFIFHIIWWGHGNMKLNIKNNGIQFPNYQLQLQITNNICLTITKLLIMGEVYLPLMMREVSLEYVASLNILVHDVINLMYYEHWIDKQKHFYVYSISRLPNSTLLCFVWCQCYYTRYRAAASYNMANISLVSHILLLFHEPNICRKIFVVLHSAPCNS